jgi:hypothetical protein
MVVTMGKPAMARGEPILANFKLNYSGWIPLTNWRQVLDFRDGLILLDEVSSWVPSRESSKLPPEVLADLNQMRKGNRRVGWAGPAWGRCDKALREVSQAACWCRGYWSDEWQREGMKPARFPMTGPFRRGVDGRPKRVEGWGNRRLFHWRWFDPYNLPEDASAQDMDSPPKDVKVQEARWYWRPGHLDHLLYASQERVLMLDTVDPSGACLECGGARMRRKCECAKRNEESLAW